MDIKEQILVALGLNKEEVKLAWQGKSEDGTIFVSTAEELEESVDVSVLTEDGTTIPLPVGTYKTDTGVSFRVEPEGVVAEVIESETEEKIEAKSEADEAYEKANFEDSENKEELAEEDKDDYDHEEGHDSEADVADWRGMEKRIKNLEIAVAKLKEDKMGGDDEVEEMSEETTEPSKNPKTIKTTEVVEFSAEDEIKKLKEENEKLKKQNQDYGKDAEGNVKYKTVYNKRGYKMKRNRK